MKIKKKVASYDIEFKDILEGEVFTDASEVLYIKGHHHISRMDMAMSFKTNTIYPEAYFQSHFRLVNATLVEN